MAAEDFPLALRTQRDFPASACSLFEDPADEKSWHQSQRFDQLRQFYAGRQPSWYANAVRPLKGARRVLDLGAGPALAMQELLNQGAQEVVGVDRWPGFKRDAPEGTPIILHDLTLPLPFLAAASFDGVLSHYVLDYVSPIAMRQVLREGHRLLEPGGKLVLLLAAIGIGGNDFTRTSPYSPRAMRLLLEEAGFVDLDVTAPGNGRNTVVVARRASTPIGEADRPELRLDVSGDAQLTARFDAIDTPLGVRLEGVGRSVTTQIEVGVAPLPLSTCVRISVASFGAELQVWAWRGHELLSAQAMRLDFRPTRLELTSSVAAREVSRWTPTVLSIESGGNAYERPERLRPGTELTDVERGGEGRRLIVEGSTLEATAITALLGDVCSRFLARRSGMLSTAQLEREWRDKRLHALVMTAREVSDDSSLAARVWASQRDVPIMVEADAWVELLPSAVDSCGRSNNPWLLVDPALVGRVEAPVPQVLLDLLRIRPQLYLVLGDRAREQLADDDARALTGQILTSGGQGSHDSGANEALRYLTERTLLMRLRHVNARDVSSVGRRPPLADSTATLVGASPDYDELWGAKLVHQAIVGPSPANPLPTRLLRAEGATAGARSPTTVFLTVDTEDTFFTEARLVTGAGLGRSAGVYGVLDELDERNLRATFFVNVYESERQPAGLLQELVGEISKRGHEIGLHTHQTPELDFFDRPLIRLSAAEQRRALQWGLDRLADWSQAPIISFRAGGYVINDATFEALERLGVRIDSSCFFGSVNNHIQQRTVNAVHLRGSVIEMPVTSALRLKGDRQLEHRKLDVDWLTREQLRRGVESMAEHSAEFVMLMMHSFTFIEKAVRRMEEPSSPRALFTSPAVFGRVAEIYGEKPNKRAEFAGILEDLKLASHLTVLPLRDALPQLEQAARRGTSDVVPIVPATTS